MMNLLQENDAAGKPRWATGTTGRGTGPYKTVMQTDGNYVLYDSKGAALWASSWQSSWKRGTAPYRLVMQNDGNLVIYDANNTPTWSTQTTNDKILHLVIQHLNLNLVAHIVFVQRLVLAGNEFDPSHIMTSV